MPSNYFNKTGFRDYLYNHGVAYHFRAIKLISLCRQFATTVEGVRQYYDMLG